MAKSSRVDVRHFDDGADAAAFLAEHDGVQVVEFDLGAGIGLVAALVLQPLQLQPVARPVRQPAGGQEAGQAAFRLRQRQEQVAHRHGEEPFVPGDQIGRAGPAADRAGRAVVMVARRSDPPCFSVIAMPTVAPLLCSAYRRRGHRSGC